MSNIELYCVPVLEDEQSAVLSAVCVGELFWRSALAAGLTVCSSI